MIIGRMRETLTCEMIDKTDNLVRIWVTFPKGVVSELHMTDRLKNLKLVGQNLNDTIYPHSLIMKDNSHTTFQEYYYLSSNTKAKDCYEMFGEKKEYDLIILFNHAEIGDKLIIDNFLEYFVLE